MHSFYAKNGYEIKKNIVTRQEYSLLEDLVNNEDRRRSFESLYFKKILTTKIVFYTCLFALCLSFIAHDFEKFHFEHYNIYLILYIGSILGTLYSLIIIPSFIVFLLSEKAKIKNKALNNHVLLLHSEMTSLQHIGNHFGYNISHKKNGKTPCFRADYFEIASLKRKIDNSNNR